jgi:hypothetical protein
MNAASIPKKDLACMHLITDRKIGTNSASLRRAWTDFQGITYQDRVHRLCTRPLRSFVRLFPFLILRRECKIFGCSGKYNRKTCPLWTIFVRPSVQIANLFFCVGPGNFYIFFIYRIFHTPLDQNHVVEEGRRATVTNLSRLPTKDVRIEFRINLE